MEGRKAFRRSSFRHGKEGSTSMRKSRSVPNLTSKNRPNLTCSSPLIGVRVMVPHVIDKSYEDWVRNFEKPTRDFKLRGFRTSHDDFISGQIVRSESLDSFVKIDHLNENNFYDPFRGLAARCKIGPMISRTVQKINFETGKLLKKCLYKEKIAEGEKIKPSTYVSYEISLYDEICKGHTCVEGNYKRFTENDW